jgi:hypothetical protein
MIARPTFAQTAAALPVRVAPSGDTLAGPSASVPCVRA